MRVLHLSTSDLDGGAARAAYRLHKGLLETGVESEMLVRARDSLDSRVRAEKTWITKLGPNANSLPLRSYRQRPKTMFSPQWFPDVLGKSVQQFKPDLLQLHWVCNGYLKIETLRSLQQFPIVWVLHDMWPLTGGCHYTADCDRYTQQCGACPQLNSQKQKDLSHQIWKRKKNAWAALNLTIVSPSNWMAECARSSSLFGDRPIRVIPHGLDLLKYQPINRGFARQLLHLPAHQKLVLFGSSPGTTSDPRKGLQLLEPALDFLTESGWKDQLELVIFGNSSGTTSTPLNFKTHYLGHFQDDISLAMIYSAADVMVVPSLQEAFGQTASEALACGTPVVAFRATGLLDIIDHQQNGYLADPFEPQSLAQGIAWILENDDRCHTLGLNAREKALKAFPLDLQANRYLSLYQDCIGQEKR